MKVLFLDVDGVLNNLSTTQRFRMYRGIDPKLVNILRRIVEATGCTIVLSSTWRLESAFRDEVRRVVGEFKDVTPDLGIRGVEIEAWLEKHPGIKQYAILDDTDAFLEGQPLFRTRESIGLTDEIADKVIEHLGAA